MTQDLPLPIRSGPAPLKRRHWRVSLTDTALPVTIDYVAEIHTDENKPVSLTQFRWFGSSELRIIATDFSRADISGYSYFFKQTTKSGFFHSKRKTIERESSFARQALSGRSGSCLYRFGPDGVSAEASDAPLGSLLAEIETLEETRASFSQIAPPPLRFVEVPQGPPWSRLTVILAPVPGPAASVVPDLAPGGLRPIFARISGERFEENHFEFLRRSSDKIVHRIEDFEHAGWHSRAVFIDPNS